MVCKVLQDLLCPHSVAPFFLVTIPNHCHLCQTYRDFIRCLLCLGHSSYAYFNACLEAGGLSWTQPKGAFHP